MRLIPADQIKLIVAPSRRGYHLDLPRSRIVYNNMSTPSFIHGVVLEAAVETEFGVLLFLTEDCPFEDGLHIYFLNHSMKPLDHVTVSWQYCTGYFDDLKFESSSSLMFSFMCEPLWRLTLLDRPTLCAPILSESFIARRWFKLRRYMRLELMGHKTFLLGHTTL